jgi:C4-type Zn-finger protein
MLEHRKHCPSCSRMRTFRGDVDTFDSATLTVVLTCVDCGYPMTSVVPRAEIEPQVQIYPR